MIQTIQEAIRQLGVADSIFVRKLNPHSLGDYDTCCETFCTIFKYVDQTITRYEFLPEYEEIVQWMMNTEGKGLLLMGSCGRGKSIILQGVIPVLMKMKGINARPVHAQSLYFPPQFSTGNWACPRCFEYLLCCGVPVIDELGVEGLHNEYGEKSEGFNLIINAAEMTCKPMFVSTNLTADEIINRYGECTLDRLGHRCRSSDYSSEDRPEGDDEEAVLDARHGAAVQWTARCREP